MVTHPFISTGFDCGWCAIIASFCLLQHIYYGFGLGGSYAKLAFSFLSFQRCSGSWGNVSDSSQSTAAPARLCVVSRSPSSVCVRLC